MARMNKTGKDKPAYDKLRDHIVSYSTNLEILMDIFKGKSYKQNIKSKSRQSETLVIQKTDFFELVSSMLNETQSGATGSTSLQFTSEEVSEIETCIQLTPKFSTMYAIRHIETLFQSLLETANPQEVDERDGVTSKEEGSMQQTIQQDGDLTPIREEDRSFNK